MFSARGRLTSDIGCVLPNTIKILVNGYKKTPKPVRPQECVNGCINMKDIYEVPPCDTHSCFFDDSGHTAHKPNALADSKSQPDESAVFSVLQFGAIIPPLSPWRGIRRFMPGYQYRGTELVGPLRLVCPANVATLNSEQQSYDIERLLDRCLVDLIGDQPDPVLLFSGGVDSGLIASRLVALGYGESLLLNYCFGEDDRESQLAEAMAKHLGLRFERISATRNFCDCLIEPGRIYPQPFGDRSTVPTSELAHAVVDRLVGEHRVILDGTGADGCFGMANKINAWSRVERLPALARQAASLLYAATLWHRKGRMEYLCRMLRRSMDMPLLSAALAQNPLSGVLYRNLPTNDVHNLLADWVGGWVGESIPHRIVAADLALTCANIFAQKGQPILELAGHRVHYPFLQTEVVSVALASIHHGQMDEPKAPLKRSLARHVPRDMVYRPKSPFTDPLDRVFFDANFIAYLRSAADSASPISTLLNQKPLIKVCDLLSRRVDLPLQTRNCIWSITFMDRWYRTAR